MEVWYEIIMALVLNLQVEATSHFLRKPLADYMKSELVLSRICPAVSLLASEIQMANTSDAEDM
jgi:recombinational DNA repair protein RecR